jgi:hypothetical protein
MYSELYQKHHIFATGEHLLWEMIYTNKVNKVNSKIPMIHRSDFFTNIRFNYLVDNYVPQSVISKHA